MPEYRVLRIEEQMYGCEELPAGSPCCAMWCWRAPTVPCCTLPARTKELTRLGIDEGSPGAPAAGRHPAEDLGGTVMNQIRTSALIGLGALGILFGRKMPGVQVIADEARIARYAAQPVVCNGEECRFSYVTPAQGSR